MTDVGRATHIAREGILNLLSNAEVAKVSSAEGAAALANGEEYLDLENLDRGVQRAAASTKVPMGQVLPLSAVGAETWSKIVAQLTTRQ